MQISGNHPTYAATGAASGGNSAAAPLPTQQVDYMKLIVAQMRNLNPMDPSSGGDGMTTMMQAESLNQLTSLNTALKTLQTLTQTGYASSLIGRGVTGTDETSATVSGVVTGLHVDASGPVLDIAGGKKLRMLDITQVSSA